MRSKVMKKYRLANRKELYALLRVYDFIRELKVTGMRPAPVQALRTLQDNLAQ